ncbi:MAG: diguanylate cyclase (GGDEF)-like protein/PAS domain S-box-containing protein [Motiliproteus sp.]|jgi:diguanylate cyclase (GGDEF)-like protein/PAS domain S-box-containing protein
MLDISAVTMRNQSKSTGVEYLSLLIWVVDSQGIIIQVEGDGLEALGIAQGQWVGLSVLELFRGNPSELDGLHRAQQGETSRSKSQFKGRWFETRYSPLVDASGQIHAVRGISVDVTDRQHQEQQLADVASGVSAQTGEPFFKAFTQHVARVLGADFAFVGVLNADTGRIDTREVCAGGISVDNFSYELSHTPCENLLRDDLCCYPNDVQRAYPDDLMLKQRGVRGYLGAVLKDYQGQSLGVLVVLYKQPMTEIPMAESLLRIFSVRAAAELEHQAASEQFRVLSAVVEQSQASIMITDASGLISYVNPAFTAIMGYSSAEVVGQTPRFIQGDDTPLQTYQQLWRTISSGGVWRGELVNKTKSGEQVYESQVITPIKDAAQRISHYVAIKADVSPLKASEQQLRRANRTLRLLSECNQALIRSTDEQQQLQRVCDILVDHGGYRFAWVGTADSAQAGLVRPQVHAGDAGSYLTDIDEHLRGERLSGDCIRQNRAQIFHQLDSQSTPLSHLPEGVRSAIALPMVRPEHNIYSVLWLLSDQLDAFDATESGLLDELVEDMTFGLVTHRTRQALNDSEAKLRIWAEDSMVGVYMIQDGRYTYANPYMTRLFGSDLNGVPVSKMVAPESQALVAEKIRQRFKDKVAGLGYEFTGLCADGRRIQVEVFGSATTYDAKPCIVGTMVDITARRSLEQQLQLMLRAIESANNGIAISDLSQDDKPYVYVNPAFEQITGYSSEEAVGHNGRFLLGDDKQQLGIEKLKLALHEQSNVGVVLRNYHRNGSMFWNELSMAPVRDDQGSATHYVSIINDITQSKSYQEQLEKLSNYDALTGLANKNLLRDRLEQSLIHAGRSERHTALLMLDLDRFKMLNQSIGISATDTVLQALATRLRQTVRQGDTLARLGSDVFAIVLHDISDLEDIAPVVRQLMMQVSEPLDAGPQGMALTCSIGIAVYPQDGVAASELLCNAEAALSKAKERRNSFHFYTRQLNERATEQLALEVDLGAAVERNEFVLYYQAKVDLRSGEITGSEALIRWIHPVRGLVSPTDFIPAAEDTGLIIAIGAWAIQQACLTTREINDRCGTELSIAVNLSAKQFANEQLARVITQALKSAGLAPQLLECELTESMLMADPDKALAVIQELKQLGIRVALDDFGTGYSSLSYLKLFPIDTLKIDRSFVKDLPGDQQDRAISRAIIALAEALELYVVAEGVETPEQRQFLKAEHCNAMQGFLFSKPIPAKEFEALVVLHQSAAEA